MKRNFLNTCSHDSNPIPYESRIPGMEVKTKTGTRKWSGKYWVYYTEYPCDYCNKKIITCKRTSKNDKQRKHIFCGSTCKQQYYLRQKDIDQFKILEKNNDNDFYYLIGLIASDGHITWPDCTPKSKNYSCTIELNEKDINLLNDIKNKFGGSIKYNKRTHSYIWAIHNRIFIEFLKTIGFTNNKSLTLNITDWFKSLPLNFQYAFIHGVFDGDGSIGYIKQTNTWFASIASCSPHFKDMLYNFFKLHGYNTKKIKNGIRFNGTYIIEPLSKFITQDGLCLRRKYAKFIEVVDFYRIND